MSVIGIAASTVDRCAAAIRDDTAYLNEHGPTDEQAILSALSRSARTDVDVLAFLVKDGNRHAIETAMTSIHRTLDTRDRYRASLGGT